LLVLMDVRLFSYRVGSDPESVLVCNGGRGIDMQTTIAKVVSRLVRLRHVCMGISGSASSVKNDKPSCYAVFSILLKPVVSRNGLKKTE
jgi:hypothetical protein